MLVRFGKSVFQHYDKFVLKYPLLGMALTSGTII